MQSNNFNPSELYLTAILNDDPSVGGNLVVASGILSVVDTNNLGQPWGQGFDWEQRVAGTSKVQAYAAGTYSVWTANFTGVTPVIGDTWVFQVTPSYSTVANARTFDYIVSSVTLATEMAAVAAAINLNGGAVSATSTSTAVLITGAYGTAGVELQDFSLYVRAGGTTIPVTNSTPLVQPAGTPQLAAKYGFDSSLILAGVTYNTYTIDIDLTAKNNSPGSSQPNTTTVKCLVLQNDNTDTLFAAAWNDIITVGTSAIADKLSA